MDFNPDSMLHDGSSVNMPSVSQLMSSYDINEPIQLTNISYEQLGNTNTNNAPQTTITNNTAILTSSELQRIYYAVKNDAEELQNLLASWNLSILFDYFARTWSIFYNFYFPFMNLHSSLHSLH